MLGDQIIKLRTARHLSQVELGQKIGVSKQSISNWENNNIMPSIVMVTQLAAFFGCTTDYLLEIDTDKRYYIDIEQLEDSQLDILERLYEEYRKLNR